MTQSPYRWVIVGLGGLMGCVAIGAMFSLAVFLTPMSEEAGWSRAGISFAMTINFLVMAFGSFAWGAASDRWGARVVTLCGAVLLGLALTLASRSSTLLAFQLTYGILVGVAASAFFAPDDRHGDRMVRDPAQSRGVAGLGGHGDGAAHDLAVRELADHALRLAPGDVFHRRAGLGAADPGRVLRASTAAGPRCGRNGSAAQARQGRDRPGADLAAIPGAGFHVHALLHGAFGADIPRS